MGLKIKNNKFVCGLSLKIKLNLVKINPKIADQKVNKIDK